MPNNLRLHSQALERYDVAAGGSVEFLRVEQTPGKILSFNVILGSLAASKSSLEQSRIKIYVDGAAESVADLALVDFFFSRGFAPSDGVPSRWLSDRVGVSSYFLRAGDPYPLGNIGYYRLVDVPFQHSALVELHNGDNAHPVTVFTQVEYLVGTEISQIEPELEYRAASLEKVLVSPGETIKFVDVPSGAGYIDSIYLAVWEEEGKSFRWPELNLVARTGDGTEIVYDSSGTEDFFFSSWGWSAGAYSQALHGHPVHRLNGWNTQYRYFEPGLWFDDGINLTWEPGPTDGPQLTGPDNQGPVEVWAVVTYYLGQAP